MVHGGVDNNARVFNEAPAPRCWIWETIEGQVYLEVVSKDQGDLEMERLTHREKLLVVEEGQDAKPNFYPFHDRPVPSILRI